MSEFTQALGLVAPWYNLALVFVVVVLFFKLFSAYRKSRLGHITPWIWIFIGVLIYIAEAVFTVLRGMGVFSLPYHVNGYFELAMISVFIYALLSKREYIKQTNGGDFLVKKKVSKPVTSKVKKKLSKKVVSKKAKSSVRRKVKKKTPKKKRKSKKSSKRKKKR